MHAYHLVFVQDMPIIFYPEILYPSCLLGRLKPLHTGTSGVAGLYCLLSCCRVNAGQLSHASSLSPLAFLAMATIHAFVHICSISLVCPSARDVRVWGWPSWATASDAVQMTLWPSWGLWGFPRRQIPHHMDSFLGSLHFSAQRSRDPG